MKAGDLIRIKDSACHGNGHMQTIAGLIGIFIQYGDVEGKHISYVMLEGWDRPTITWTSEIEVIDEKG
tara:strand:+ start:863 stop:1066 length:204 start_codon:yes stop_codon:yes gene_type:complete